MRGMDELWVIGCLLIKVESTRQGTRCGRCGREIHHFHGHDRPIQLRHLPLLERRVYLEIRPKRYRCSHCEGPPTTTQRCDWYVCFRLACLTAKKITVESKPARP